MQRHGHKLTITQAGKQLVANCQCGKWRRALAVSDDTSIIDLVAILTGKHDRHLDRLGRPSAVDASTDALPVLPDDQPKL